MLEPVLKLLKAYIYYYLAPQNNRDKINQRWGYVGECHRRLPHYFKQEFFNNKPFSIDPLPTFKTTPARAACRCWNNTLFDLDDLGIGTTLGLYYTWAERRQVRALVPGVGGDASVRAVDMTVVAHLYKLRITGLGNIIEQLRHPETANTLVNAGNGVKPKS